MDSISQYILSNKLFEYVEYAVVPIKRYITIYLALFISVIAFAITDVFPLPDFPYCR